MNKLEIERNFITNFILKDKRVRSLSLLQNTNKRIDFINKFNHSWSEMISVENLIQINSKSPSETLTYLLDKMNIAEIEICYVISHDELDGGLFDFKTAFENSQLSGFATLIITTDSKKIYLKTEQVSGAPKMFVGLKK
uniref:hypothetical protein n=2 Tax=Gelidibacter sp. TaxID=2018083 RepID=UPI00404AAF51